MKHVKFVALFLGLILMASGCGVEGNHSQPEQGSEVDKTESTTENKTETESQTESETESIVEPVVSTLTITATGDCALGALQYHEWAASFHQYYDENGESYFFEKFSDIFAQDDLTLVNLECVFTDAEGRVDKQFNIKGKETYAGILTSQFVEACSLGNNHTLDYGVESLTDTQNALNAAGVLWAYNDVVSYFTSEDGIKVAMVSVNLFKSAEKTPEQYLFDGIEKAKQENADLIIVSPHWGIEMDYHANASQQDLGHRLIDAGADLVIGNHPHVLQGIEYYNGKMICYSLANFSFGANRNPSDKKTMVYQQTFTFVDGELQADVDAKIIPARVSGANSYNNYQPIIAEGDQKAEIIKIMNDISAPFGGVTFDENGIISISE